MIQLHVFNKLSSNIMIEEGLKIKGHINQIKQEWVYIYFLSDKDFQKRKLLTHNYIMVKGLIYI